MPSLVPDSQNALNNYQFPFFSSSDHFPFTHALTHLFSIFPPFFPVFSIETSNKWALQYISMKNAVVAFTLKKKKKTKLSQTHFFSSQCSHLLSFKAKLKRIVCTGYLQFPPSHSFLILLLFSFIPTTPLKLYFMKPPMTWLLNRK